MPLLPPWTSRVSPGARRARSNTLIQTVKNVSGSERRFSQAPSLRDRQAVAGRRDAELGVAAAGRQRADLVAFFPLRHALAELDHGAGDFQTGQVGAPGGGA